MPEISDFNKFLSSIAEATKDISNIVGMVEKNMDSVWSMSDKIEYRWERRKLDKLLRKLHGMYLSQSTVPSLLRGFAHDIRSHQKNGDEARLRSYWEHIEKSLMHMSVTLIELHEFLKGHHSIYMTRNPDLFHKLIEGVIAREGWLGKFDPAIKEGQIFVFSEENADKIESLSFEYQELIDQMILYRSLLSDLDQKFSDG